MTQLVSTVAEKLDRAVQKVTPFAYRVRRQGRRLMRRALRKPRSVSEGPNLLPVLIQVLASFSKADGVLLEEEIDSSLGFLRYDYPEAVYSELRQLFRQAVYEEKNLAESDRLMAFRYRDLILLKNYSSQNVSVRGRPLVRGGFCRIYQGQRILVGDNVLTYQELAQYFNAKKNVSVPQIFIRVNKDADEVGLERARTRESALEIAFGLKVRVKALSDV